MSRNDNVYKALRLSVSSRDDEEKRFRQETTVFIEIRVRSQVVRLRRGRADHYKHCRFSRFLNAAVRVMIVVTTEVMDFAVVCCDFSFWCET